jgi:hypothetical protein
MEIEQTEVLALAPSAYLLARWHRERGSCERDCRRGERVGSTSALSLRAEPIGGTIPAWDAQRPRTRGTVTSPSGIRS